MVRWSASFWRARLNLWHGQWSESSIGPSSIPPPEQQQRKKTLGAVVDEEDFASIFLLLLAFLLGGFCTKGEWERKGQSPKGEEEADRGCQVLDCSAGIKEITDSSGSSEGERRGDDDD